MKTIAISLLCLIALGAEAQARGHRHHAVSQQATSCIRTDDTMRPCMQSAVSRVVAAPVKLKQVASRLERRGRHLIAYEPSVRQSIEKPAYAPAIIVERTTAQVVGGRPSGCPHAYCGCGTSLHVFGKIVPDLNLASNWRRFPSAAPAAGMVAYRNGHVFAIESVNSDGTVVAYDSNSGRGLTRVHSVSLRGYRVVNPHG